MTATSNEHELELDLDLEETEEDEEIYVDYDIAAYPSDSTLSVLQSMWERGDIEIPEYQRGFVWTIKQSSLLVESFLRGLPVPPIFFFIDENNKSLVVDGQQRLKSILYFLEGYFGPPSATGRRQVFRLSGLNAKSAYAGKTYKDLSETERRKFDGSVLRAVNIRQLSPAKDTSSVYHIFERLNTGGTPLSPQEIRNTVYRGPIVKALHAANADKNWRKIIGKPTLDKRDRDAEIILRLLGLFIQGDTYESPMKRFLNETMDANKKSISTRARKFFEQFPKVCEFIIEEAGERPFSPKGPLNVAILDGIFTAVASKWPSEPSGLGEKIKKLIASKQFIDIYSSRTADTEVVRKRLRLAREAIWS